MRIVYGRSEAGSRKSGGQVPIEPRAVGQSQQNQIGRPDRVVHRVSRINGDRIRFADLARFAWPTKTEANLAFVARVDARTARRWLAGDTEPPSVALGIILAEIMRRFHQRD